VFPKTLTACSTDTDRVICRCLRVHESAVAVAIDLYGAETWHDVRRLTGAGAGCMGCHCAIKDLLARQRGELGGLIPE
jgi:NAD(P)H-nitrite reductase large subunit